MPPRELARCVFRCGRDSEGTRSPPSRLDFTPSLHPALSCAEEARKTLRSLNLSRAGPVAKSTALAAQPRSCGCPGFHNANYDRFVLPLRKCSGERRRAHRLGYRFLRTLKLQLCPRSRACFIRQELHNIALINHRIISRSICCFFRISFLSLLPLFPSRQEFNNYIKLICAKSPWAGYFYS